MCIVLYMHKKAVVVNYTLACRVQFQCVTDNDNRFLIFFSAEQTWNNSYMCIYNESTFLECMLPNQNQIFNKNVV